MGLQKGVSPIKRKLDDQFQPGEKEYIAISPRAIQSHLIGPSDRMHKRHKTRCFPFSPSYCSAREGESLAPYSNYLSLLCRDKISQFSSCPPLGPRAVHPTISIFVYPHSASYLSLTLLFIPHPLRFWCTNVCVCVCEFGPREISLVGRGIHREPIFSFFILSFSFYPLFRFGLLVY